MKVSVVIPSCREQFLARTVDEVLTKARGDVECIVHLDGYWPEPALPDDKRLIQLHSGKQLGMRPGINRAVAASSGEFLMKLDAHCMLAPGFDLELQRECEADWVVVPRRHRLDAEAWAIQEVGKPPIDYHYLSYPFEREGDESCGLHGTPWYQRCRERADIEFDDEMSSQGSCWFMRRSHFNRIGPLDVTRYGNFIQEFQEIGLKTWLGGGAVKVNKRTWYAHLHKGKRWGRGYSLRDARHREGAAFATRFWMLDLWKQRTRDLRWLIEKFSPVPTWPEDLGEAFARAKRLLA